MTLRYSYGHLFQKEAFDSTLAFLATANSLVIGASLGATDAFGNLLPWEVIVNPTLGFPIMVMIDYNIKYQGGFTQCKDTILF